MLQWACMDIRPIRTAGGVKMVWSMGSCFFSVKGRDRAADGQGQTDTTTTRPSTMQCDGTWRGTGWQGSIPQQYHAGQDVWAIIWCAVLADVEAVVLVAHACLPRRCCCRSCGCNAHIVLKLRHFKAVRCDHFSWRHAGAAGTGAGAGLRGCGQTPVAAVRSAR